MGFAGSKSLIMYNMARAVDLGLKYTSVILDHMFHQTAFFLPSLLLCYYLQCPFLRYYFLWPSFSLYFYRRYLSLSLGHCQQFFVSFAFFALLSLLFLIFLPQFLPYFWRGTSRGHDIAFLRKISYCSLFFYFFLKFFKFLIYLLICFRYFFLNFFLVFAGEQIDEVILLSS